MLATWGANQGFSPSSLFSAGEQGAWYDPSDLTTLFQDAAGTTPVTAVEQPVGLILDKTKNQALGSELIPALNLTSGWNPIGSLSSSTTNSFTTTGIGGLSSATVNLSTSKAYKIVVDYTKSDASTLFAVYTVGGSALAGSTAASGSIVSYGFPATSNAVYLRLAGAASVTINSITIKEIGGNHAYQSSSASRPTLSARYNLLTKTEQFDDAAWSKNFVSITPNSIAAPDGTLTADTWSSNTTSYPSTFRTVNTPSGVSVITTIYAKAGTSSSIDVELRGSSGSVRDATFTLTGSGTATINGSAVGNPTATITLLANGWYRCKVTKTTTNTTPILIIGQQTSISGNTFYIWGADLRVANDGVGIPDYQRVNTATDYDTVGFPKYLSFNGSSSAMVTNTITPGTDKAQVFAGVRKLSDAATGLVAEMSDQADTNAGTFRVSAPASSGTYKYYFLSRGSLSATATTTDAAYAAPITSVLSGLGNISEDSAILRVNGTQVSSSTADQGTGNYLAYPLYIGARAGTSAWFNGRVYSMIVRFGANLSTSQIVNTENYVNSKTKAY